MLNLTKNLLALLLSLSLSASFSGYQKCPDKTNGINQALCPERETSTGLDCQNVQPCDNGACQPQKENDPAPMAEPKTESESETPVLENQEPTQPAQNEQETSCPTNGACVTNDCETDDCESASSCDTPSCQTEKETATLPESDLNREGKAKTSLPNNLFSWFYSMMPKKSEKPEVETESKPNTIENPIKETANEILRLVNVEREKAGLKPLRYCVEAQAAADKRALEIKTVFSHTRPDGRSCFTVFDDFSIKDSYMCAENIACGYPSAQSVMNAWMNSPGHKANILSTNATALAIGINGNCYVQTFAHDYQTK